MPQPREALPHPPVLRQAPRGQRWATPPARTVYPRCTVSTDEPLADRSSPRKRPIGRRETASWLPRLRRPLQPPGRPYQVAPLPPTLAALLRTAVDRRPNVTIRCPVSRERDCPGEDPAMSARPQARYPSSSRLGDSGPRQEFVEDLSLPAIGSQMTLVLIEEDETRRGQSFDDPARRRQRGVRVACCMPPRH